MPRHSLPWQLCIAVSIAVAAVALRLLLDPWLGQRVPFITLFAAVAAVVWLTGPLPAVLATAIGLIATSFLWPESDPVATVVSQTAYVIGCGAIVLLGAIARRRGDEAHAAATALDREQRLLRLMINSLPMLVAYVDRSLRYRFNNRTYREWFGPDSESLEGRRVEDVVGREAFDRVRSHIERVLAGETLHFETSLPYPSGTREVSVTFAPHCVDGGVEGYFAIIEDISARRRSEHASAHLAAIVASSGDAIVSKSLDGIVQSWNAGAERLFGWSAEDIIGQSITKVIPPERLHEESDILARLARGERLTEIETERMHRDGHLIPVSLTISPVFDASGRIIGASKIARDISERRRIETERREELRRKDEFLATLAHELRNPLAPILNAAQSIPADALGDPRLLTARNMIERQARHMTRLVDDLLDLSRISHGQIVLRRAPTDLLQAIDAALEACQPLLQRGEVQLQRETSEEALQVDGDPTRLAQIVSNLVGNAAKFTPRGGTVRIALRRDADLACIVVEDNGVGIAADMLDRIFEMFTQAGSSPQQASSGLGIGLALARKLAELHGGELTAHSDGIGKGSRFELRLPLSAHPAMPVASIAAAATTAPLRILIADDNVDAARSLSLLLGLEGHQVEVVHDGNAAVSRLAERLPDVALLDIGMPGLDGYEVARRARSLPDGHRVRLIALTGWGQDDARRRSQEAGFDAHLTKPADAQVLEDTLRALCGQPAPAV